MAHSQSDFKDFSSLYTHILTLPPPLTLPAHPTSKSLTPQIAALSVHPTLEAALHLLNNDLPAAHFLVRHMQSAPAYEGMFLHGIVHRIEGDYDNARAWYNNVKESEVFLEVWGGGNGKGEEGGEGIGKARTFIDKVEGFTKREEGDREELERQSTGEIKGVVEFCRRQFGDGKIEDARDAFVANGERIQKMTEEQITGGKGFRKF